MQHVLLANLKLAVDEEVANYTKCGTSLVFPGYNYFVSSEGKNLIERLLEIETDPHMDPEDWMLSLFHAASMADFEKSLFDGFPDARSILSRMIIMSDNIEGVLEEIEWIESEVPAETAYTPEEISVPSLPLLGDNEILSFADYDAVIDLLKAKQHDPKARRALYTSMVEILLATESHELVKFDGILDVFFSNILIGIQQSKYICPDEARQFMSFVMKSFVIKSKKGV